MPLFSSFLVNLVKSPSSAAQNTVQPTGAAVTPLVVKGAAAQSATLQEWQNSAGSRLAQVDAAGGIYSIDQIDAAGAKIRMANDGSLLFRDSTAPFIEFLEVGSAPAAGAANTARVYAEDNGSGKTRLVVKFATGSAIVIATQA